ncbi:unnamed protein product, partial [Phaeothamnion confervicola]
SDVSAKIRALHREPAAEDWHLCCVCMQNTRDAAIVHGATAHQICCFNCAMTIFLRGGDCPCCRRPIDVVVRNFL